jgi:TolA-binding protein
VNKNHCLIVTVALSMAATCATWAGEPAPSAPAAPTAVVASPSAGEADIQELDEVLVRGERLVKAINDAEDNFYDLFNKVNTDNDYDTSCVYLNTDPDNPGSQIKSRVCIPGFVADAMADWAQWKVRCQPPVDGFDEFDCLDRSKDNRISWQEASARPELEADFTNLDEDDNGSLDRQEFSNQTYGSPALYQPPPPQLVLMERSNDWYDHMMKVINTDPRLQEMAGHLDDLYHELQDVQYTYQQFTAKDEAERKPVKVNLGPRAH